MKSEERLTESAYALLRIVSGFMFAFHGAQIVLGFLAQSPAPFGTQHWWGGLIELLGGLAVMLGLQTRTAAFISSGTMAVAYVQFHWKFQLGAKILPGMNQGELSALYAFVLLLIACKGAGKWGVDKTR